MVNYLVSNQKMSHSQFHIIGHSLGAHVSGFAGNTVRNGKIARITGLDPAKPGFEDTSPENRLDEDDAEFVDVIHTCAGVLGYSSPLGKADFYPNKGTPPQPGCGGVFQVLDACSHGRAYVYFAESIRKKDGFLSRRCANSYEAKASSCGGNGTAANKSILMGDAVPFDIEGVFYLPTNDKEPYANNFN